MAIRFVVTEHPEAVTVQREGHYERLRRRLERAARATVLLARYTDLESLDGAPAVVLSGSFAPWADHEPAALSRLSEVVRAYSGPMLGICAGMQLQAMFAGGSVARAAIETASGFGAIDVVDSDGLFRGLPAQLSVYRHHSDEIVELPNGFRVLASSPTCPIEAIADDTRRWWGTQFHPEEFEREHPAGERILRNFFELAA